jgi:alpha-tubulin suppressor-like RCC1 family protein
MVLICGNGNSSMNSNGNSGVSLSTEQTELIVWGGNDKG